MAPYFKIANSILEYLTTKLSKYSKIKFLLYSRAIKFNIFKKWIFEINKWTLANLVRWKSKGFNVVASILFSRNSNITEAILQYWKRGNLQLSVYIVTATVTVP